MQNGEIYNYPELTAELEARGHRFATHSDTEVIVHAFEQWGEACLDRLDGEFAFAVWDRRSRELFLARDRFGIRPLFLAGHGRELAFASEAKALLRHPRAERRIDPLALVETFTVGAATRPQRLPGDPRVAVRALPSAGPGRPAAGAALVGAALRPRTGLRQESPEALAEELRALLDDATRIRLRADVPVGVYLSGGLDSSATAALARRHTSRELRGFGIGFEDERFDESRYQDAVADALGVELTRVTVSGRDVADAFPEVVRMAEKPMLRTAPGPLLRLSRLVRESGMKVVLTGEGADEIFGGYNLFQEAMVRRFWARRPESRLRPALIGRLYPYLARDLNRGGGFLAEFFRAGLEDVSDPLYSHRPRFRTTARNLRFLSSQARAAASWPPRPARAIRGAPAGAAAGLVRRGRAARPGAAPGDRHLPGGVPTALAGRPHAHGQLRRRALPFLDVHVAEFAASLPERLRLRDLDEKYLLRKAVAPLLPEAVWRRPKRPYRAPIVRAFVGPDAPEYVRELLDPERVDADGLFAGPAVARLLAKAERYSAERHAGVDLGESDEMGLVGVLSGQLLAEQFVRSPRLAEPAEPHGWWSAPPWGGAPTPQGRTGGPDEHDPGYERLLHDSLAHSAAEVPDKPAVIAAEGG